MSWRCARSSSPFCRGLGGFLFSSSPSLSTWLNHRRSCQLHVSVPHYYENCVANALEVGFSPSDDSLPQVTSFIFNFIFRKISFARGGVDFFSALSPFDPSQLSGSLVTSRASGRHQLCSRTHLCLPMGCRQTKVLITWFGCSTSSPERTPFTTLHVGDTEGRISG